MVYVAMYREGYTNAILWISHHKTPEGAANACMEKLGKAVTWEEDWQEYNETGYRRESINYGHDWFEIQSYELHL